jgi:hypothetical protein
MYDMIKDTLYILFWFMGAFDTTQGVTIPTELRAERECSEKEPKKRRRERPINSLKLRGVENEAPLWHHFSIGARPRKPFCWASDWETYAMMGDLRYTMFGCTVKFDTTQGVTGSVEG